ncbi:MAG TPA: hypothetical protein ENI33_04870 [Thermoplasmatales archaeon]|nr:hypothetical protein [Thermoplasmatales archaeon]
MLSEIKGIGTVYEKKLNDAGIKSIEDLAICDLEEISGKTGIGLKLLRKWKEEARKKIGFKVAVPAEDLSKISFIEIYGDKARVKIKNVYHDNIPVYSGKYDELKEDLKKEEMAVVMDGGTKLWFNGNFYENVPYKIKKPEVKKKVEKSFFNKLKEWWRK